MIANYAMSGAPPARPRVQVNPMRAFPTIRNHAGFTSWPPDSGSMQRLLPHAVQASPTILWVPPYLDKVAAARRNVGTTHPRAQSPPAGFTQLRQPQDLHGRSTAHWRGHLPCSRTTPPQTTPAEPAHQGRTTRGLHLDPQNHAGSAARPRAARRAPGRKRPTARLATHGRELEGCTG